MLSQDGAVDGGQGVRSREGEDKDTEVTLCEERGMEAAELETWGPRIKPTFLNLLKTEFM